LFHRLFIRASKAVVMRVGTLRVEDWLNPRNNKVLFETLEIRHWVNKFPPVTETHYVINKTSTFDLSRARLIQTTTLHFRSPRPILTLSSYLRQGFFRLFLFSGYPI